MSFKVSITSREGQVRLRRMEVSLRPRNFDKALQDSAWAIHRIVRRNTPTGLTGRLKKAWRVWKIERGYLISNDNPDVVKFLEFGTRAHGPVRAKALYIPLTRAATVRGWSPSLRYGRDYILRKWVRGITATHFIRNSMAESRRTLKERVMSFLRRINRR